MSFTAAPDDDLPQDKRWWWCANCGRYERRHHNEKQRPFCDECESRDAVLIEMRPKGKATEKVK